MKNKLVRLTLAITTGFVYVSSAFAQVPNDPEYSNQWGLKNTGQYGGTVGADIDAQGAWDIETGSDSVVVAIVDSGLDINHPDLAGNIWVNQNEIPGNGIDDDGNGYIDDVYGWDFVDGDNDIDPGQTSSGDEAREFHGTHVAGIVGAVGNDGIGMSGVAWNVQLMGVRFYARTDDSQELLIERAVNAIRYAVDNGADIINASFGYDFHYSFYLPSEVTDAFDYAEQNGVLVVCAAGNDAMNIDDTVFAPGGLSNDNILTVASTDRNDEFVSAYNYGPTTVDVAAPGYSIYSTMPYSSYAYLSGTSMSTPYVAGIAALLLSQDPSRTALELKQIIMDTVDPLPSLEGKIVSGGRVNAANALNYDRGIPEITLLGQEEITVELGSEYVDMGATAYDKQDGDITNLIDVSGDTVDTSVIGTYIINYNVTDSNGNTAPTKTRTVNVVEAQECAEFSNTLSGHESAGRAYSETTTEGETCYGSFCFGGTEVTTWYAVGSDEELGTNSSVTVVLHEESEGVYATGACPGPDLTAPVITLAGDNPMTVYQGSAFTDPGATAEDNIDGNITADIVVTGYVDTNTIDSYEITYTVSDAAGNETVATRTVNVVAMPACQEYTDTVANHESAGRAYSVTETTGETCWGSFCYGGTTTTTYYAQGSDESLGTNGSATVTLITSENGYSTGSCPSDPVAPVIESTEVSSISYYNAVITGVASDANNDIDHVTITANEQTFYCEGTTNFTCTLQYNVYDIAEVGEEHNATLTAYDSRDAASNPVVVTLTRPEQQASVPPVVSNVQQTREGTVEVVTVNVTDVDGDLEEVVLYWMDYMGGVGCTNTGGDQYRCELELSGREYGTSNWAIRALDEAGNVTLSDTFTIVWEEEIETCFTAANSEHVSAGRAELRYSVLVYAAGSGDYLGMSGDTTSLEETSDGVWSKVSSCQ